MTATKAGATGSGLLVMQGTVLTRRSHATAPGGRDAIAGIRISGTRAKARLAEYLTQGQLNLDVSRACMVYSTSF